MGGQKNVGGGGVGPLLLGVFGTAIMLKVCSDRPATAVARATPTQTIETPAPVETPAPPPTLWVIAPSGLNLRAEPSASAAVLGLVPTQASVLPSGRTSGVFSEVIYNSQRGWVATEFLADTQPAPVLAQPAIGDTPGAAVVPDYAPQYIDPSSKTVHVSGYTRRDGTYVPPYNRRPPHR